LSAAGDPGRRAVILAGGKGTRLGPFTTILPKPLLPVGDRAIVEIIIHQLRERGFTRLTLAVGYLSHLIAAVLGDGSAYGVSVDYHLEHAPLGTAGALAGIDDLDEAFLMMNGDVITTLDYDELMRAHQLSSNALTVAVQARTATIDFGVLELGGSDGSTQAVVGYHEKPQRDYIVSMGIYILEPSLLGLIEDGVYLDFPDLVLRALASGARVGAYRYDGLWLDIGRHDDYERAIAQFSGTDGLLGASAAASHPAPPS
jgi:NDP-mannose synthase